MVFSGPVWKQRERLLNLLLDAQLDLGVDYSQPENVCTVKFQENQLSDTILMGGDHNPIQPKAQHKTVYCMSAQDMSKTFKANGKGINLKTQSPLKFLQNSSRRKASEDLELGNTCDGASRAVMRPCGAKDRYNKVYTSQGPRDRRVQLSLSTAVQVYDIQERLGYDRPSRAIDWLVNNARAAIDELPRQNLDASLPSDPLLLRSFLRKGELVSYAPGNSHISGTPDDVCGAVLAKRKSWSFDANYSVSKLIGVKVEPQGSSSALQGGYVRHGCIRQRISSTFEEASVEQVGSAAIMALPRANARKRAPEKYPKSSLQEELQDTI